MLRADLEMDHLGLHPGSTFPPISKHSFFVCIVLFCFLRLHLGHVEAARLGVESELQLPVHATATAMPEPS